MNNLAGAIKNLLDSKNVIIQSMVKISHPSHSVKACLQRNSKKPCAKCGGKNRHTNKEGECISSLCAKCYKAKGKRYRKTYKDN